MSNFSTQSLLDYNYWNKRIAHKTLKHIETSTYLTRRTMQQFTITTTAVNKHCCLAQGKIALRVAVGTPFNVINCEILGQNQTQVCTYLYVECRYLPQGFVCISRGASKPVQSKGIRARNRHKQILLIILSFLTVGTHKIPRCEVNIYSHKRP